MRNPLKDKQQEDPPGYADTIRVNIPPDDDLEALLRSLQQELEKITRQ